MIWGICGAEEEKRREEKSKVRGQGCTQLTQI